MENAQDIYNRFQDTALDAIKAGKDFWDYSHKHNIPSGYITGYNELKAQYQAAQEQAAKPSRLERLEKEVVAAMGVEPEMFIDDSMP